MQFSRSTEATNGGLPPASLRTEQRYEAHKAPRLETRSTFQEGRRQANLAGPAPSNRQPCGGRPCELPRKEVIQPQLPLRLPCYDFTPITSPTFDGSLP